MSGIRDILYVCFAVPDFAAQRTFLQDFGLQVFEQGDRLYARGTDASAFIYSAAAGEAGFAGLGFEAESEADLNRIAAIDGVAVESNSAPGGGLIAKLKDPDGVNVDVVWGMKKADPLPVWSRSAFNDGQSRPRLGERVSFDKSPHSIKRLGHCVLEVSDFKAAYAWYHERFGLIVSDEIYAGDESNVIGAFLRCDRGDTYTDHHTLFLLGTGNPRFNHAAFEIADWDALMDGHFALQNAGYEHSWGVGKHLLGSQVFDYWKDPHGFTLEHFTDGDLFNASFGSHKAPVEQLLGSHWGPQGGPT